MSLSKEKYGLKSVDELKRIMGVYFQELADGDAPIAWCSSVGPAELLRSFGFRVYFPENHGALLGSTRTAGDHIPAAVKCGFSADACSYTTSDIGAFLSGETPMQKHYGLAAVPQPDLIAYSTNQCREVADWFSFYSEHFQCPIVGIHPPRYLDEVSRDEIDLVVAQFRKMIPICEQVTGRRFDEDRFKETLKLSAEATHLWQAVLATAKASPPPLSFFDSSIHMGPIVVMRGSEPARDYYQILLDELNENVSNGIGILPKEQCRIFWDGMPIWGKLRALSDLFLENQAALVASTYCNSWIFDHFDEKHPFESSALAYTQIFINRSEKAKLTMLQSWIEEYQVDGIIFHDAKTCFNNSNASFGLPQRLKETTGIASLIVEGDLCDLRFFSEAQTTTKIETFIQQIVEQRRSP